MAGPRWVKLDLDYFRNPKALDAGLQGRALHLASVCYSAGQLTDGVITSQALSVVLADAGVPRTAVGRVVDAGLWLPNGSGWVIHDFVVMNGSRAEVLARIEADRKRKAKWWAEHRGGASDDG